jgi:hypothetical protein
MNRRELLSGSAAMAALVGLPGSSEAKSKEVDYAGLLGQFAGDVAALKDYSGMDLVEENGVFIIKACGKDYELGPSAPGRLESVNLGHGKHAFIPLGGRQIQFTDREGNNHTSPYVVLGQSNYGFFPSNPSEAKEMEGKLGGEVVPISTELEARLTSGNTNLILRGNNSDHLALNQAKDMYQQILKNL